jgi:hypothetical protein
MRNNERFGRRLAGGLRARRGIVKKMSDRSVQFAGIFRIKQASDGRMPDVDHLERSFVLSVRFRSPLGARATPFEVVPDGSGRAALEFYYSNGIGHCGDDL